MELGLAGYPPSRSSPLKWGVCGVDDTQRNLIDLDVQPKVGPKQCLSQILFVLL